MTPKEKAKELFDKFNNPDTKYYPYVHNAQQCASIAVDEIINSRPTITDSQLEYHKYWKEVKKEIENL